MVKLNRDLLKAVKQGFVPQPGGQAEPVAGAGPMTAGLAAGGMGDPAAAGGMPVGGDPAAAGGAPMLPPPGLDPAMAGMMGGGGAPPPGQGMSGSSTLTLTVDDLIKLFKVFQKNSGGAPAAAPAAPAAPAAAPTGGTDPRVDKMWELMKGVMDQGGGGGGGEGM